MAIALNAVALNQDVRVGELCASRCCNPYFSEFLPVVAAVVAAVVIREPGLIADHRRPETGRTDIIARRIISAFGHRHGFDNSRIKVGCIQNARGKFGVIPRSQAGSPRGVSPATRQGCPPVDAEPGRVVTSQMRAFASRPGWLRMASYRFTADRAWRPQMRGNARTFMDGVMSDLSPCRLRP